MKIEPIRCLIEIADGEPAGEQWADFWCDKLKCKITLKHWFRHRVFNASMNRAKVWKVILASDEIWMDSVFIGASAELFHNMMVAAKECNVKNKLVINIRTYKEATAKLSVETKELMKQLKDNNGIRFIFSDNHYFKNRLPK